MEDVKFKEEIIEFQLGNSSQIIDTIIDRLDTDLLKLREQEIGNKITVNSNDPVDFVAYRIKAMMEKFMKGARSERAGNMSELIELNEVAEQVRDYLNLPHRYSGYTQDLKDNWKDVSDWLKNTSYPPEELWSLIEHFDSLDVKVDKAREQIKEYLMPFVIEALEYALTKVDVSRSIKEVVKYINRAWATKYWNLQMKEQGVTRKTINGIVTYVSKHERWDSPEHMILGDVEVKRFTFTEENVERFFNKNQKQMVRDIITIINNDITNDYRDDYTVLADGLITLNKRAFAKRFGLNESNFKHKLKRIQDRIVKAEEILKQEFKLNLDKYLEELRKQDEIDRQNNSGSKWIHSPF